MHGWIWCLYVVLIWCDTTSSSESILQLPQRCAHSVTHWGVGVWENVKMKMCAALLLICQGQGVGYICYHCCFAFDVMSTKHWWYCDAQKLKKDYDALVKSQTSAKKQLEDETIMRVDLENRIQSLKEELAFLSEVHKQVGDGVIFRWDALELDSMLWCLKPSTDDRFSSADFVGRQNWPTKIGRVSWEIGRFLSSDKIGR